MVQRFNHSTLRAEAGGSLGLQGQCGLHSKFKATKRRKWYPWRPLFLFEYLYVFHRKEGKNYWTQIILPAIHKPNPSTRLFWALAHSLSHYMCLGHLQFSLSYEALLRQTPREQKQWSSISPPLVLWVSSHSLVPNPSFTGISGRNSTPTLVLVKTSPLLMNKTLLSGYKCSGSLDSKFWLPSIWDQGDRN